jgi:hypothetical protein
VLHNKPLGCGATVASAAGPIAQKKIGLSSVTDPSEKTRIDHKGTKSWLKRRFLVTPLILSGCSRRQFGKFHICLPIGRILIQIFQYIFCYMKLKHLTFGKTLQCHVAVTVWR